MRSLWHKLVSRSSR